MYQYQPYPKALYHRDGRTVVVNDETEQAALDEEDWADTPGAFAEPEPESAPAEAEQGNRVKVIIM